MNCPKCGFEQPDSADCLSCGIVFAKYRPDAAPPHPEEHTTPPPIEDVEPSPFAEPVGRIGRLLRAGAALLCATNAVIMWLNGSARATFAIYAILVFFAVACVHLLITIRQRVTLRQLSIELVLVAVVSLTAKLSYPQIFDLDETATHSTQPVPVRTQYSSFLDATGAFDKAARALVLSSPNLKKGWSELRGSLDGQAVRAAYEAIPVRERVAAYDVAEIVKAVAAELEPFVAAAGDAPPTLPDDLKGRIGGQLATLHDERMRLEKHAADTAAAEATP